MFVRHLVMLRTRPNLSSLGFKAKKSEAMEKDGVEMPEGNTDEQPTGMWEGIRGAGPELVVFMFPVNE